MSRVLVVDDNATNIVVLSTMLQKLGFQTDEASSGIEAVNAVCHEAYSLVLVDHLMPEMDGVKTIEKIRFVMRGEECPQFIGVSSNPNQDVRNEFATVEVSHLLERPVKQELLEEMLKDMGISIDNTEVASGGEKINLEDILKEIEGVDYKKGIELMTGSAESYMKVLPVCVKNVKENCTALESVKGTKQFDSFSLHFHSLKGIFLNIAADAMAEEAKTLEFAAKAGDIGPIEENIDAFLEKAKRLNASIAVAADKYAELKSQEFSGSTISDSEFTNNLMELKQHIEDFEFIEITELLEKMTAGADSSYKDGLDKVNSCIQEFDYDGALDAVNEMLEA